MPTYTFSDPAVLAFVLIPAAVVLGFVCAVYAAWRTAGAPAAGARRAATLSLIAAVLWLALTWLAADSGLLRQWERRPPPVLFMALAVFALGAVLAFSRVGTRIAALPVWVLVAGQAFRWPLELAMHTMFERGIMPEVMSYSGRNFDVVTGITAVLLALLLRARRVGRGTAALWNLLGLGLLLNVVSVAILATPVFAFFGPDQLNVWVTYPPFVWLPTVLVVAALAGHIIVLRALYRPPIRG